MIEPTRRRIGRADLRHRHGENETDEASDQPAHPDRDTAGARSALGERVDAARQDADDREGYCEVGETAQTPLQLLGVSHAVEDRHVLLLVGLRVSQRRRVSHVSHIPTPSVDRLPARIHTVAQVPARSCVLAAARRPAGTPHRRFHEIAYALAVAIDGFAPEQHDRGWWEARRM